MRLARQTFETGEHPCMPDAQCYVDAREFDQLHNMYVLLKPKRAFSSEDSAVLSRTLFSWICGHHRDRHRDRRAHGGSRRHARLDCSLPGDICALFGPSHVVRRSLAKQSGPQARAGQPTHRPPGPRRGATRRPACALPPTWRACARPLSPTASATAVELLEGPSGPNFVLSSSALMCFGQACRDKASVEVSAARNVPLRPTLLLDGRGHGLICRHRNMRSPNPDLLFGRRHDERPQA